MLFLFTSTFALLSNHDGNQLSVVIKNITVYIVYITIPVIINTVSGYLSFVHPYIIYQIGMVYLNTSVHHGNDDTGVSCAFFPGISHPDIGS